jgi:N-acetylneuraminate synthase
MNIAGREIGPQHPPYVIAEISCNHGGYLPRALRLIEAAKAAGADAVKFQCVTADTITIDCQRDEFLIKDGPWAGWDLHALYTRTETPFTWFAHIAEHAAKVGITWFASCFDKSAVNLMCTLGAPAIKIASFELVDTPLIEYAASSGKPMILSTGMASGQEVEAACQALEPYRQNDHALLHCVSGYPTPPAEANLLRLKYGIKYGFVNGISDHSIGPEIPIAATALGACIIEKHFRMIEHPETEDTPFSIDQYAFAIMVRNIKETWAAIQPPPPNGGQDAHRPLRRSLFAVENIAMGETFTVNNVRSIRPGHGLPPGKIDKILGRHAQVDIERGEPLSWKMVE